MDLFVLDKMERTRSMLVGYGLIAVIPLKLFQEKYKNNISVLNDHLHGDLSSIHPPLTLR